MAPSVKLSRKTALSLLDLVSDHAGMWSVEELRAALKIKRPAKKAFVTAPTRKQEKAKKDRTKKAKRQDVRALVFLRAGGRCECGCGRAFTDFDPGHFDHFFGRARAESVETCWALARDCDRAKTLNSPSAEYWLVTFQDHCERHGYEKARQRAANRMGGIVRVRALEELRRSSVAEEAIASAGPAGAKS